MEHFSCLSAERGSWPSTCRYARVWLFALRLTGAAAGIEAVRCAAGQATGIFGMEVFWRAKLLRVRSVVLSKHRTFSAHGSDIGLTMLGG